MQSTTTVSFPSDQVLKLSQCQELSQLVQLYPRWLKNILIAVSNDPALKRYITILRDNQQPDFDYPERPAANASTTEKNIHELTVKEIFKAIQDRSSSSCRFVSLALSSIDHRIRAQVESDPRYNPLINVLPMNALEVFRLIKSKIICEEFHLASKRIECELLCRSLPMRRGESIDQYITRFNETNEFGVTHLNMTPTAETTKLEVFLQAISSQTVLSQFHQIETLKSGVERAATVAELQARLRDFTMKMKIETAKSSSDGLTPQLAGLGLTAQLSEKPRGHDRGRKNRNRSPVRPTKSFKTTGPIQQGEQDDRLADQLKRYSHYGKLKRDILNHNPNVHTQRFQPQRESYHVPHKRENPLDRKDAYAYPQRTYAYPNPKRSNDSSSRPNHFRAHNNNINNRVPNSNDKAGNNFPKHLGKSSLFNNGTTNQRESYTCFGAPGMSLASVFEEGYSQYRYGFGNDNNPPYTPIYGFRNDTNPPYVPIFDEWFMSNEDINNMPYDRWLRTRTILDTGSEFHVVNDSCPKSLANKKEVVEHKGEVVGVKGVVGPTVEIKKVTVYHAVGQPALVMPRAPVSLLSLTGLLIDFKVFVSENGDRFAFCSKEVIRVGDPNRAERRLIWIDFQRVDRLYVLTAIRLLTVENWQDLMYYGDRESLFSVAPIYIPPTATTGRRTTRSMDKAHAFLAVSDSIQCYTTVADNEVIDYSDKLQNSPSFGYDHSPLVSKSFLEKARIGEPEPIFSKREIAKAEEVKKLKLSLRGISDFQLRKMIVNNLIKGSNLTPKDVDTAKHLFGNPDLTGKLTEASPEIMTSPLDFMNSKHKCEIYCDVMKLTMTSMFLVGIILPFNLLVQVPLVSTSTDQLRIAFLLIMGFITAYNHELKVVHFDLESGIRPLEPFFLQRGILLELSNAKTHISRVERAIRTLKERLRTTIQNAAIATPRRFLRFLVESTVRVINYQVDERTGSCPSTLFGLSPLSFENLFPWMEYGEVPAPLSNVSNSVFRSRTEEALALAPHRSSNGIHVWLLNSKSFAIRDRFFPKPLTANALSKMKQLEQKEFLEPLNLPDNNDNIPDLIPINHPNALGVGGGDIAGLEDAVDFYAAPAVDSYAAPAVDFAGLEEGGGAVRQIDIADAYLADPDDAIPPLVDHEDARPPLAHRHENNPTAANANPQSTKSYHKPWVDPKNIENDIHTDWEKDSGKGRFRYDDTERNVLIPELVDSFQTTDGVRRSTRAIRPVATALLATTISKQDQMEEAKLAEVKQLIDRDTLDPIMTPPPGSPEFKHTFDRLLDLFMLTKEKVDSRGEHIKFKARYVLNGSLQSSEGYEAKHLSAPTPSDCIIFLMIAIAAYQAWSLSVMDIGGAFLHSYLLARSYVYAKIDRKHVPLVLQIKPEWYQYVNSRGEIWTRVQKGLYGLRESPQLWAEHLRNTLINDAGYTQNPKESCVYQRGTGDHTSILVVFVDDILVISKGLDENRRLEKILTQKYDKIVNQTGDKLNYLGMELLKVPGGFEVTQVGSIEKLLSEYAVVGTRPTPGSQSFLEVDENSPALTKQAFEMFRSVVMSLLYVARRCRPDIQFQVVWLTSRMHVATVQDLFKLHHLMKYLNGTRKMGLRLVPRDISSGLVAQIDSSHGIHLTGHGHWGMCIYFYGMCILCVSKKIKLVTRSSFESEMMGVNSGGVYVLFFLELLQTLGINVKTPVKIMQDNMSAIGIMTGEHKLAMSSKHIALRNLWVMDYAKRAIFEFVYLVTTMMTPDILGKNLVGYPFRRHRYGMMGWPGTRPENDSEESYSLA
jgi:hypothetical protein